MKMEMQISDEQIFFIAYCTGSWWRVIFGGRWIFKYDTIPEKYSSKIFISFLSSGSTFSFSVKVILSFFNIFSVRYGFTVFQNYLFSTARPISRFWKSSFYFFVPYLNTNVCFLYVPCDDIFITCLNSNSAWILLDATVFFKILSRFATF